MSRGVAREAVELAVLQGLSDRRRLPRTLVFFGGEPLLKLDLVSWTICYAQQRQAETGVPFSFLLSTNGVLLTESTAQLLRRCGVRVQLSLDGDRSSHDATRRTVHGEATWDCAVAALRRLQRAGPGGQPLVRTTITGLSAPLTRIILSLQSLGVSVASIKPDFSVAAKPAESLDAWVDRELEVVDTTVDAIRAARARGTRIEPLVSMADRIKRGQRTTEYCSAGQTALSISPSGAVFACHQLADRPELALAETPLQFNPASPRCPVSWTTTASACSGCWARWICGGFCRASGSKEVGNLNEPNAQWCRYKKLEARIATQLAGVASREEAG